MSEDGEIAGRFGLADALKELRSELLKTVEDGKGKDLKFVIEDVALDLQIVATAGLEGGAGVKWWVLNADAGVSTSDTATQKLALKLKVTGQDGETVPMSGKMS